MTHARLVYGRIGYCALTDRTEYRIVAAHWVVERQVFALARMEWIFSFLPSDAASQVIDPTLRCRALACHRHERSSKSIVYSTWIHATQNQTISG